MQLSLQKSRHWEMIQYKAYLTKCPLKRQIYLNIFPKIVMIDSCYMSRKSPEKKIGIENFRCFLIDCKNILHANYEHHEAD